LKTIELTFDAELNRHVRDARRQPIILTRKGKPVAAIIDLPNTDVEAASLSSDPQFMAIIARSRKQAKQQGTVPFANAREYLKKKRAAHSA
jgi:PHD/YefM family antitoxin component YafN of YafNO toxin-antitoxin module